MHKLMLCGLSLALAACSGADRLTQAELAKLSPPLQQLVTGKVLAGEELDATRRPDGDTEYAVIIRSSNPEELRRAGIPLNSVFGDVCTARLTLKELRSAAALPSVRWIETGTKNFPQ
jgi:hypothetical protein